MYQQENISPKKGPHRGRFFSSMDFEQYSLHFGPPKPFLKPAADPQIQMEELTLDDTEPRVIKEEPRDWAAYGFGRNRGFTLPIIKQSKMSEQASNYETDKKQSSVVEVNEEPDFFGRQSFKRSHSRMRSMSQNPNLLILSLLDRAQRMQKCGKAESQEGPK